MESPRSRIMTLAGLISLLTVLTVLTGCGLIKKDVILHPIQKEDIQMVKKGEVITAPKDGAFVSDVYITEVMQAKIEEN